MSVPHISLSGKKKNSLHKAVSAPALSPNFAATGAKNPHLRVFVAHFDGTQNDYKDVPAEFQETLVASSFRSMFDSDVLANRYYHGVGTRTDGFIGMVQSAFGMGCEDRAERAYIELAEATREWRMKDPLVQVHVHVVGFSRGSAIAVHFMNLVHERGVTSPKTSRWGGGPKHLPQSDLVSAGKVLMSAALLDTVSTGQTDVLKLGLPPTAVSVLHLTAGGEQRFLFPLTSLADASRPSEIAHAVGVQMPGDDVNVEGSGSARPDQLPSASSNHAPGRLPLGCRRELQGRRNPGGLWIPHKGISGLARPSRCRRAPVV